jgi:ABC-type arginine transport system permease subunit
MLPQLLLSKEKNISLAMAQPPLSIAIMVLRRNATYANKNQLLYKKHLYTDLLNHIPYTLFLVFLFYGDGIA